jgi:phosphoserine phosphatase
MKDIAFCFDLDGTLTKDEILPIISREVDLHEEIMALTEATINGILPFERSFKLRVKLLSETNADIISDKLINVRLYEKIIDFIKANKDNCFIITGNLDVWTNKLISKIGCKSFTSTALMQGPILKGIKTILNKGEAVDDLRKQYKKIVVVGDGMNDVPMFEKSDIRIANASTHLPAESVMALADYVVFSEEGLCHLLNTL